MQAQSGRKPLPISLVVAVAENGAIGLRGGLPWRLKADLQRFRTVTMDKPMIMGRSTFDSIGRALDGRDSIVLTRNPAFAAEGAIVVDGVESAVATATAAALIRSAEEICVIGGSAVFAAFLPRAGRLHVTHIHARPEGDVTFPPIVESEWSVLCREALPASAEDTATGTYVIYDRR